MGLFDALRSLLGTSGERASGQRARGEFVCMSCGATFDREQRNCTECGGLVVPNGGDGENGDPRVPWN